MHESGEKPSPTRQRGKSSLHFCVQVILSPPSIDRNISCSQNFRKDVHKLASALRREREKSKRLLSREKVKQNVQTTKQQPVRLSFDAQEKSFVIDGDHDEVARILSDLNKISAAKEEAGVGTPLSGGVSLQTPASKATPGGFRVI